MKSKLEIKCPSCDSDDVSKPRLSGLAFVISVLLLGFPIPFYSKKSHCFNCGLDFKNNKSTGNLNDTE